MADGLSISSFPVPTPQQREVYDVQLADGTVVQRTMAQLATIPAALNSHLAGLDTGE